MWTRASWPTVSRPTSADVSMQLLRAQRHCWKRVGTKKPSRSSSASAPRFWRRACRNSSPVRCPVKPRYGCEPATFARRLPCSSAHASSARAHPSRMSSAPTCSSGSGSLATSSTASRRRSGSSTRHSRWPSARRFRPTSCAPTSSRGARAVIGGDATSRLRARTSNAHSSWRKA